MKAKNLNAGWINAADMTAEDRDELATARELAGEVGLVAALREWKAARDAEKSPKLQAMLTDVAAQFYTHKKSVGVNTKPGYDGTLPTFLRKFDGRTIASVGLPELEG